MHVHDDLHSNLTNKYIFVKAAIKFASTIYLIEFYELFYVSVVYVYNRLDCACILLIGN